MLKRNLLKYRRKIAGTFVKYEQNMNRSGMMPDLFHSSFLVYGHLFDAASISASLSPICPGSSELYVPLWQSLWALTR